MSKFFQALENAERDRAQAGTDGAPTGTAEATTSAANAAPRTDNPAPVAVATPPAPKAPAPTVTAAAPAVMDTRPAPRVDAETAIEPAPAPMRTFGSPMARSKKKGRHADVFLGDGASPTREAGQLDDHLVSLLEPTGFAAEQYRTVRLAIENFRRERGLHVVAVSSPGRGEGKTISAINLAGALGQAPEAKVVLVDADLRHPRVADYLGLATGKGISSYLLDAGLTPDDVIEKPSSIAFSVVPAGPVSSMPYELLKSPRFTTLFQTLRSRFDFVVVDTPPVLLFPDVGILRDAVDGFVLIVRANRTPREGLVDGLDTIGRHRVLGLVFNDDARNGAAVFEEPESGWRKYVSFKLGGGLVD